MKNIRGKSTFFTILTSTLILFISLTSITIPSIETGTNNDGITPLDNPGYEVTVTLDQYYYYQGEAVHISTRLTENGSGYQGQICPSIFDPYGILLSGGICVPTDEHGYFNLTYPLNSEATLGVYTISVEGHFGENLDIIITQNVTFEVVSSTVEPDAGGPYEGFIGEPIFFLGLVTGGKPPYTWLWEFGDGNTSTLQNTSHIYSQTGPHVVNLTVTDNQSTYNIDTTTAIIYGPGYGYNLFVQTGEPTYYPGEPVGIFGRLTDNGTGVSSAIIDLEIFDPYAQSIYTSNAETNDTGYFIHVYDLDLQSLIGVYLVNASIMIGQREVSAETIFEVLPHVVVVDAHGPYKGRVDELIEFHGSATGGIQPYTYVWEFGDGTVGSGSDPTHSYNRTGEFQVNLTATDAYENSGTDTTTATILEATEVTHTVLIEYGTATTCVPCVTASQQLYDIYRSHAFDFWYVTLVTDTNNPAEQRFHELASSPYPVPDVYFDGGFMRILGKQDDTHPYEQAIQTCKNRSVADLDMSVEVEWKENALLGINVSILNHDAGVYRGVLRVYIVEPTSRWNTQEGKPYHFGLLDYSENSVSVITQRVVSLLWDGTAKGYSDISPTNIRVIAAVFDLGSGYVDETASDVPGDAFTVQFSKPIGGLYLNNMRIRKFFTQRRPIIIGPLDIELDAIEAGVRVIKVEFYVDNDLKATDTSKPYSWSWTEKTLLIRHTLKVKAYGNNGQTNTVELPVWKFF